MRYPTHAGSLVLAVAGCVAAVAQEPDALALQEQPKVPFSLAFKDDAIAKAVRETVAESKAMEKAREGTTSAALSAKGVLKGDQYDEFGRRFSEAQKPSCLGPEPLKHQPAGFTYGGWNFGLIPPLTCLSGSRPWYAVSAGRRRGQDQESPDQAAGSAARICSVLRTRPISGNICSTVHWCAPSPIDDIASSANTRS